MSKLGLAFSGWQGFAGYLQRNCDSEQETADHLDEHFLYRNMGEWLNSSRNPLRRTRFEREYAPPEFQHGGKGHPRQIDYIAISTRDKGAAAPIQAVIEAKFLVDEGRDWPDLLIADALRLASIGGRCHRRTVRLLVAVGRRHVWEAARKQRSGSLDGLLRLEPRAVLPNTRTFSVKTDAPETVARVMRDNEYLATLAPAGIQTQLVGFSLSNRADTADDGLSDENARVGMDARVWRITPRG